MQYAETSTVFSFDMRCPAPKDSETCFQQLCDSLVHPHGQICPHYRHQWAVDRLHVIREDRTNPKRDAMLRHLLEGLFKRIDIKRHPGRAKIYLEEGCVMSQSTHGSIECFCDVFSVLQTFCFEGQLPFEQREAFFRSNPKSMIYTPGTIVRKEKEMVLDEVKQSTEDDVPMMDA